jgi:hypothetical protein
MSNEMIAFMNAALRPSRGVQQGLCKMQVEMPAQTAVDSALILLQDLAMTKKEFLTAISNGKVDIVQAFLDVLSSSNADYCVIGGLAVNAYAEPVVSLDLDIVVAADNIETVIKAVKTVFNVNRFAHSVNLSSDKSDLRLQLQTDSRYQAFISRAANHLVLGYDMKVASVEDVLQGKIWAYLDEQRRKSKRQKDLADIVRLIENYPSLAELLPKSIQKRIE